MYDQDNDMLISEADLMLGLDDITQSNESDYINAAEAMINANAFLMDMASVDEICEMAENPSDMDEFSNMMGMAMETSVVRLDRKSRLAHLKKSNVFSLARKAKNPKYQKLLTLWQMERQLEGDLVQIYGNKATELANKQIMNYGTNGIKKIPKAYPDTNTNKSVTGKVARRALNQSRKFFNPPKKSVNQFKW